MAWCSRQRRVESNCRGHMWHLVTKEKEGEGETTCSPEWKTMPHCRPQCSLSITYFRPTCLKHHTLWCHTYRNPRGYAIHFDLYWGFHLHTSIPFTMAKWLTVMVYGDLLFSVSSVLFFSPDISGPAGLKSVNTSSTTRNLISSLMSMNKSCPSSSVLYSHTHSCSSSSLMYLLVKDFWSATSITRNS